MYFGGRNFGGQNAVAFFGHISLCLDGANCGDPRGPIGGLLRGRLAGGSVAEFEPLVLWDSGVGGLSRRHGANGEAAVPQPYEPALGMGHAVGSLIFVSGAAGFVGDDGTVSGSVAHAINPECGAQCRPVVGH